MKTVGEVVGVIIAFILLMFLIVPLATLGGAVAGWIVGWWWGNTILDVFSQVGIHNITMWQLGAFLGFVSSFFRTSISNSKS